jgi:hypothetical protein
MKKAVEIPECYSELTTRQYKYLLRKFWRIMYDDSIDTLDIQRDMADYLLGRRKFINPYKREQYLLLVNEVASTLSWMFEERDNQLQLAFDTTYNLIPKFGKYLGPQSHGVDLRFGEFRTASDIMMQYKDDDDTDILDALVGVLYRKPNKGINKPSFDGNFREPFNKHHIERYARRVNHLPDVYKYGIYLWFANFCQFLISGEFNIEGRDISFAPIFGSGTKSDSDTKQTEDKLGMLSILFTLADAGTFGNVEQTDNAPLLDVMCKLLNDYNTAKNMNAK